MLAIAKWKEDSRASLWACFAVIYTFSTPVKKDHRFRPVSSWHSTCAFIFLAYAFQLIKSLFQSLMDWPKEQQLHHQPVLTGPLPQGNAIQNGKEEKDMDMMKSALNMATFQLQQKLVHLVEPR